jgi:predicted NUDIX family NTP pyrophosphohydrolase
LNHRTDAFDIWVYRRIAGEVEYLLLHTSIGKAEKWFNGGRFWQIPTEFTAGEKLVAAAQKCLSTLGLTANSLWAAEHVYTIYNSRYEQLQTILVLAAECDVSSEPALSWEHSEYRWCRAEECLELVSFRGLEEGLESVRRYVTQPKREMPELRLL